MKYGVNIGGYRVVLDGTADRYLLTAAATDTVDDEILPAPEGAAWPAGPWRLVVALESLLALTRIQRLLERASFQTLLDAVGGAPVRAGRGDLPVETLLASFEAARPLFPKGRICRLDAPALCLLLRAHGHDARVVFGVRLEPFAAHCWAECGGRVINEPLAKIRAYAPLVAL